MSFRSRHDVLGLILLGALLLCGSMPPSLCSYDVLTCFATPGVIGTAGLVGLLLGLWLWDSFPRDVPRVATGAPDNPFRGSISERASRDLLCRHQVFLL